jgi:wyosine [tRNA(Phe)-imidazoG37] synthetase (radical SAM superfamily)
MLAFGPVPSRRLGQSLGINNIPPKICTYACVYCQLGRTLKMQAKRQAFYEPTKIFHAVRDKVEKIMKINKATIDFLTFVPDGEPTLDINLGLEIEMLRPLGIPIAVITNSSLIWRQDVRTALMNADWVSLKVDAVEEGVWRRIDRPHGSLELAAIQAGALEFARAYQGKLVTETMLVAGLNDGEEHMIKVADFLARLQPDIAYLAIPTRPPAEESVRAPDEDVLNRTYQILSEKVSRTEYLIGYEGDAFAFTGDVEDDILSITAVHPMREDAMDAFLARAGAEWEQVQQLVVRKKLVEVTYQGHNFYLKKLKKPEKRSRPQGLS